MMMGCFGGHVGLRTARAIASVDPSYRILVVCCEICSLHWQMDRRVDNIVACSLFGDAASAIIVGTEPLAEERSIYEIHKTISVTLPNSRDMIKWDLSATGSIIGLSEEIPEQLNKHLSQFVSNLLCDHNIKPTDAAWPIHPGGVSIINAIERSCGLTTEHTKSSRNVLARQGNNSSGTVLTVLDELRNLNVTNEWAASLSFGPGICIEGCLLKISKNTCKSS